MIGTLRIGGDDVGSEKRLTAITTSDRIALIDRLLQQASTDVRGEVLYLEIDREGDGFTALDRYRHVVDGTPAPPPTLIELVRVGVAGQFGAAEYVRNQLDAGERTVHTTHNNNPGGDQPQVLYDTHVPTYFAADAVLPLVTVRQLVIDFATTGEWPHTGLGVARPKRMTK